MSSERLSETIIQIDRWADLDAKIDQRYGDTGRSIGPKRVIIPRAEYDELVRRANRGDRIADLIDNLLLEAGR